MICKKLSIKANASIKKALHQISKTGQKSLVVVTKEKKLLGTLSDGDLRRSILKNINLSNNISNIFNKNCIKLIENNFTNKKVKSIFIKYKVDLIPIVNTKKILIDILTWDKVFNEKENFKKIKNSPPVVIMAGGKGTRLKPFTQVLPKPLVPINNKPFIQHIAENFFKYGCSKFFITVNFKSKIIKAFFEELKPVYKVIFQDESKPLGTVGALSFLRNKIKESFFVSNSDVLVKTDLEKIYKFHINKKFDLTLIASTKEYVIPYGTCDLDKKGHLLKINEKPIFNFLVNTGLYLLKPEIIKLIPLNKKFDLPDLLKKMQKLNYTIGVFPVDSDSWLDVGEWNEYYKTRKKIN